MAQLVSDETQCLDLVALGLQAGHRGLDPLEREVGQLDALDDVVLAVVELNGRTRTGTRR